MMKRMFTLASLIVIALGVTVSAQESELPWFDLEKCAFCKELGKEPGLLDHMDSRYHNFQKGVVGIMVIDKEFRPALERVQAAMTQIGAEMQKTGEIPYMCGHCRTYGELMMSDATLEQITDEAADIMVWTSDNPETVKKLQAFAKRTNDEMAKWRAEQEAAKAKE